MTLPFDVNNAACRRDFLNHQLMDALNRSDIDRPALWGHMSVQHMIEHLVWTFNASVGQAEIYCNFSEVQQLKMKPFIHSNRATTRAFKNPMLPAQPQPLAYTDIRAASIALKKAIAEFSAYYSLNPDAQHVHPLFGVLGREEWERVHYKHCFHHLLQFDLISQEEK